MRVYLALTSQGAPCPPRFREVVSRCAEVVLFRESEPWHFRHWASRDGRTRLVSWCNEPDDPRLLPPLLADGETALGCPGYLGDPDDHQRLFRTDDPGALADQLPGVFGVFRAQQDGFVAITTLTRLHPVYYASTGDFHLAGNRALLVHLVERRLASPPTSAARYDIAALQSLVRNGFFLGDDTPFEGVKALAAHCNLEVVRGVRRIVRRPFPEPGTNDGRSGRGRRVLIRDLADSVVKAVAPLRAFSEPITLQLTGGRDSRLIAAALHAAAIPFSATTSGVPEHPDVVLAARIADLLGTPHRIVAPKRQPNGDDLVIQHPLLRAWGIIRSTEGMVSVLNTVGGPMPFRIAPTIAGWGGEQLRGGYLPIFFKTGSVPLLSAIEKMARLLFTKLAGFLTDAANERAESDLAGWFDRLGADADQILDRAYLYHRTGRWASALAGAKWATLNPVNPLLDNLLTRHALGIPPLVRWSEQPVHEVVARLAPPLRDLPLTGTRWRYDHRKPVLPFARRGWSSRSALRAGRGSAGFDWRLQPSPHLVGIVREQILDGPSRLFEIVKRRELENLLAAYPLQPANFVWHVYTASVLLSNVWLAERPQLPPIAIRPPAVDDGPAGIGGSRDDGPEQLDGYDCSLSAERRYRAGSGG